MTPWTAVPKAPLSMRFPRQEYWSGWLFSSPGDLPNPGIEPMSPALHEKVGLKLNIHKTKIMASGPITSWQTEGEKLEVVTDFLFLVSNITADGECNHEIRRCFLLGRKTMTNLDSVLKSRDITLLTKIPLVLRQWKRPRLEWRQEPQASSPFLTRCARSLEL